jgi:putative nucleotidyltransferase with HDIG domain
MRLRTRVFLFSFVPFAILLTLGFLSIERQVRVTVREGLRTSLRENHQAFAKAQAKSDIRNNRFLRIAGENAALKAGIRLLKDEPTSGPARETVEDQLRELCARMNFDLLSVAAPDGASLAGVARRGEEFVPSAIAPAAASGAGLVSVDGQIFQIASVPVDQAGDNLGSLLVGERFDVSVFPTPSVLVRNGRVLASGAPGVNFAEIEAALRGCEFWRECEIELRGNRYLSLPVPNVAPEGEYHLRSLQDLGAAEGPLLIPIRRLFIGVSCLGLVITLICSAGSAGEIARPVAAVISHLKYAEHTGRLGEMKEGESGIREIRDLVAGFNRAATAVREARAELQNAYVEFTGSLASALDARDPYTAGHSRRVSLLSCALAETLRLESEQVERVRIGALLHDIGKIGIADDVLQKPGRLSEAETALIRQHPEIGRKILEGVQGFSQFLNIVELHHENQDGSGYPRGLKGEDTPIDARIVHVADAYDAMTTDRPYRPGMNHAAALLVLAANAGTQFDPEIVRAFMTLPDRSGEERESGDLMAALSV